MVLAINVTGYVAREFKIVEDVRVKLLPVVLKNAQKIFNIIQSDNLILEVKDIHRIVFYNKK